MKADGFSQVLRDIRACRLCRDEPRYQEGLPHEPRPVLQASKNARILLAGQAPGARVHRSGRPFTDPSGDRLRDWLGMDEQTFYDASKLAIVPMGFCFPGYDSKGADKPPRRECRETWHDRLFASREDFALKLVIGRFARDYHLPTRRSENLTTTIAAQVEDPRLIESAPIVVLPHPSWRNTAWLSRNPWFENVILPTLRERITQLLSDK